MRALIRKKVAAGELAEEIVAYFVERYGEEVALVPRRQGLGLALWWGPVAIFVLGGAVVARTLWGGRRPAPSGPAEAGAPGPPGPPGRDRRGRDDAPRLRRAVVLVVVASVVLVVAPLRRPERPLRDAWGAAEDDAEDDAPAGRRAERVAQIEREVQALRAVAAAPGPCPRCGATAPSWRWCAGAGRPWMPSPPPSLPGPLRPQRRQGIPPRVGGDDPAPARRRGPAPGAERALRGARLRTAGAGGGRGRGGGHPGDAAQRHHGPPRRGGGGHAVRPGRGKPGAGGEAEPSAAGGGRRRGRRSRTARGVSPSPGPARGRATS